MTRSRRSRDADSDRGQSELVGTVVILGLSLLVVSATVAVGAVVLSDRQAEADLRSAETSMTSFASQAALVSAGNSESRAANVPGANRGSTTVDPDQGRLLIELREEAGGSVEETLVDRPLGGVTYHRGDSRVAYEGGGVWRADGDRARMVSPPPVHYRGTTFTMPVPLVEGGSATGGDAVVTRGGAVERAYPDPTDPDRQNPLAAATVHVTVESDYYEAWGRFFESRTGGTVSYDHDADRVTLQLATEDPDRRLRDATVGTATGRFEISGAGGSAFTDSYNSSEGPYDSANASDGGRVVTAGDLRLRGGAEIHGDVEVGGSIDISGSTIHGNASYGDSLDMGGNADVGGWTAANASVAPASPVDTLVFGELSALATENDNADVDAIDGTRFASTDEHPDAITLTAGSYYLDDVDLDGRTLRLNVSDGTVRLGVDGTLDLSGEEVEVVGEGGRVRTYVARDVTVAGGDVRVEDDVATRLWVYGTRDTDVEVSGGGRFVGVVYAPSGTTGSGTVDVRSDGAVYGAIVGGETTLQSGGTVHFDTALQGMDPVFGADVPRVTYLHVSGTPIVVDRR